MEEKQFITGEPSIEKGPSMEKEPSIEKEPSTEEGLALEIYGIFYEGEREGKYFRDIRTYSPLTLAYVGDGIYDLIIRTMVVERANRPANDLHRLTIRYVSANAQSKIVRELIKDFTEEEQSVYRRGKNSKPHTTAKNASVADYMRATGFEAVLGYLYLTGRMQRVLELVKKGVFVVDGKGGNSCLSEPTHGAGAGAVENGEKFG
jgi:ribonuclease-3 family protein